MVLQKEPKETRRYDDLLDNSEGLQQDHPSQLQVPSLCSKWSADWVDIQGDSDSPDTGLHTSLPHWTGPSSYARSGTHTGNDSVELDV